MIHKKVILVSSGLALITLLVRLVRPQDCAWFPLGETLWPTYWITLVDLMLIALGWFKTVKHGAFQGRYGFMEGILGIR